jgi:hypothetical protein
MFFLSALVFGQGVHWFLTPHPTASDLRVWAVAAQVIIAFGVAVYSFRRMQRLHGTPT